MVNLLLRPQPRSRLPSGERGPETFTSWKDSITTGMLHSIAALRAFRPIAEAKADALEVAAPNRSYARSAAMLQECPATGLCLQVRLSRGTTGWIPDRAGLGCEEGGVDDTGGLTVKVQAQLMRGPPAAGTSQSPMGAQREAGEQRGMWLDQWGQST